MTTPTALSRDYKTQAADTTIAAELILLELWRSQTPSQRAINLNHNTRAARSTAWHIAKTTLATQSNIQQVRYFLKKVLVSNLIEALEIQGEIEMVGAIEEALIVARILESLGICYFVGGSIASGIWGEMRYTQDIDLVADIQESQINLLLSAFTPRFYISEVAIREALESGNSFNLIDNQTGWKIDIFVLTQDAFKQSNFQRRRQISVDEAGQTLILSSPEDMILQKLLWYQMTQQSSQQWRDILGILKLQQPALDFAYLHQWADTLQLSTLLNQAFGESGF